MSVRVHTFGTFALLLVSASALAETGRYDACYGTLSCCSVGDVGVHSAVEERSEAETNCATNIGDNPEEIITCCFNQEKFSQSIPASTPVLSDAALTAGIASKYSARPALERDAIFRSLKLADTFTTQTYVYVPSGLASERTATSLAAQGQLMAYAHRSAQLLGDGGRALRYRMRAQALADSISAKDHFADQYVATMVAQNPKPYPTGHRNLTVQGLFGWGRFWDPSEGASHIYNGGYTYFIEEPNCSPAQIGSMISRPYEEEAYDVGQIARAMIDMFEELKPTGQARQAWFDSALQGLNSFLRKYSGNYEFADQLYSGSTPLFYTYKSTGPCQKNYLIKNTNMLMGVSYALAHLTRSKYSSSVVLWETDLKSVADRILFANNDEIAHRNFGYYSYRHQISSYGGPLKKARADLHQTVGPGNKITCLTSSCWLHLAIEPVAYYLIGAARNWWTSNPSQTVINYIDRIYAIETEFEKGYSQFGVSDPVIETRTQSLAFPCTVRNLALHSSLAGKGYVNIKQLCTDRTQQLIRKINTNPTIKWDLQTALAYLRE